MTVPRVAIWTVPATAGQYQLGTLVMGKNTPYAVQQVEGLGLPDVRTVDATLEGQHGVQAGADTLDTRHVIFKFFIHPDQTGSPTKRQLRQSLLTAFNPVLSDDVGLTWLDPDLGGLLLIGRPRRTHFVDDHSGPWKIQDEVLAQFDGTDPLIYGGTLSTSTLPIATAGTNAGLTFARGSGVQGVAFSRATGDKGVAFNASAGGASGYAYIVNNGNAAFQPVTRIYGPADTPILGRVESGEEIQVNAVLPSGDYIELDHRLHTALYNGVQNRIDLLATTTPWWVIQPGLNTIHYRSFGAAGGSSAQVNTRDAWLGA